MRRRSEEWVDAVIDAADAPIDASRRRALAARAERLLAGWQRLWTWSRADDSLPTDEDVPR